MVKFIKDKLRRPYHLIKHTLSEKKTLNFEYDTLPLVDKDVSLDEVMARADVPLDTPYDLREKLEFWRENGYVVLEKVLPPHWLDLFWDEVEDTIENHEKHVYPSWYKRRGSVDVSSGESIITIDRCKRPRSMHNPSFNE